VFFSCGFGKSKYVAHRGFGSLPEPISPCTAPTVLSLSGLASNAGLFVRTWHAESGVSFVMPFLSIFRALLAPPAGEEDKGEEGYDGGPADDDDEVSGEDGGMEGLEDAAYDELVGSGALERAAGAGGVAAEARGAASDSAAQQEAPSMPDSYEEFAAAASGLSATHLAELIRRIRATNAAALAEGNRRKMQVGPSVPRSSLLCMARVDGNGMQRLPILQPTFAARFGPSVWCMPLAVARSLPSYWGWDGSEPPFSFGGARAERAPWGVGSEKREPVMSTHFFTVCRRAVAR
jgi:hypothetical protein